MRYPASIPARSPVLQGWPPHWRRQKKHAEETAAHYEALSAEKKAAVIDVINISDDYDLKASEIHKLDADMIKAYASNAAGQVGMGYAVGYPFGVIVVILAVNFLNVIFRFNVEGGKAKNMHWKWPRQRKTLK